MFPFKIVSGVLLAAALLTGAGCSAAQNVDLPNGNFEEGLKVWTTRSQTEGVYQILSPGHEGKNYARLQVDSDDPQRDREAVYFNRRDLPTQEGYYRFHFAGRSTLEQGSGGARIVNLDAEGKVLSSVVPAGPGIPPLRGKTEWTEYDFIYQVPPQTAMSVLQLEGSGIIGSVDYDDVSLEKVDDAEGKKLLKEQSTKFVIPPFVEVAPRTSKFPLKAKRLIYTDEAVATARANIEKYPEAKEVLDAARKIADPWLEWSDEDLRNLLTSARVPRAFDLNVNGCPVHGREVFNVGGAYPWKLDPRHPLKVTCPVGGEVYPSNDYEAYVKSGFKEKKGWDTQYVDDGWGWVAPDGERYWFVAYANQWNWYKTINPAFLNLARAYVLTGDKKYAHKAAVMLYRMAEIYPEMDYNNQSRYAMIMRAQGGVYPGKILNHIWETFMARDFAEAYDAVWDSVDGDSELQKFYGKTGPELRGYIEANLLEDAIAAYESEKIEGNFGMHQTALLYLLLARDHPERQKYYQQIVEEPGQDASHIGLRHALYDLVWRDGIPYESPGYNQLWVENFAKLADLLKKGGFDLFTDPRLKSVFDGPLTLTNIGRFTPSLGDSSGVMGGLVGQDPDVYAVAYQAYRDPKYLDWLAAANRTGARSFTTWDSLFRAPLPETPALPDKRVIKPQPSRLLAGYGVGILNNPADTVSLSMAYSMHISHYHWDFLHFDLFANGQPMMPDLGYPDAMNAFVSSIFTWSTNTIAHNTVVVDAKKQEQNLPGTLHDFAVAPFARSIDASSPAYKEAETYRRNLIQVDIDDNRSYVVDVFRVKGGKQHDYSLHGPPGQVETTGSQWSEPAPGTLAGPEVEYGEIYDAPALADKDYKGSYGSYRGSGFQHLFKVQKLKSGTPVIHYRHEKDPEAQLRIHLLDSGDREVFLADAYDLPRARKHIVKYLIARRRSAGEAPLESTFCGVFEPFAGKAFIQSTALVPLTGGRGTAIKVQRDGGTDIILSDPSQSPKQIAAYGLDTDARTAVVTLDAAGKPSRVFFSGGSYLKCGGESYSAAPLAGTVSAVDARAKTITVALPAAPQIEAGSLVQRVAHFSNERHHTVHPIASATLQGNQLTLRTADDLLIGRARVRGMTDQTVTTDTPLAFAATYKGATLLTADFAQAAPVEGVDSGEIKLGKAATKPIETGSDVWFSSVGNGDRVEFPPLFYWSK